jgi:hypothetical protein
VYCDSTTTSGGNLRDPFVMADPAPAGGWLQYYSTVPDVDVNRYLVGVASSAGDLAQWTDLKPLWATYKTSTGYELAESPHLFEHEGLWYLAITSNGVQPLIWMTSPDPTGEPAAWTQRGTVSASVGLDTRFWFASEYLRTGLREFFAFVNFDRVDVRELEWRTDGTFFLTQPDLFHVTSMSWDRDSVVQGDPAELTLRCVNWTGRRAHLEAVELHDGIEELIPNQAIDLPDSVAITDTVATVAWQARRWQGGTDTDTSVTRLLVRTKDRTMEARVLYVGPPGFCGPGGNDPGGEIIDPALRRRDPPLGRQVIRTLTRAPVGGGLALLVELDRAQPARLDVFDLQGRRLGTLADRVLPAGATVVPWDARRAGAGRAGICFARLTTPGGTHWTRVVVTP